jgi:glc operon protein GlcG
MACQVDNPPSMTGRFYDVCVHDIRTIGHHEAQQAIAIMAAECAKRGKAAVFAAADAYGEIIAVLRMDGASLTSLGIAQRKAFTAAREGRPSKKIGERIRHPEIGHDIAYFGDARYIGWGGGLPVIVNDVCVGGIAMSGLPEAEDIEICQMAIDALTVALA